MNIFSVLGVNYEVFHTRMLGWLFSPAAEHALGDRPLQILFDLAHVQGGSETLVSEEVKIDVPNADRYRLADLVIRSGNLMLLVENKVDPSYQDAQQLRDEVAAGRVIAEMEGRTFAFVLVAPGPLHTGAAAAMEEIGGVFIPWSTLVDRLKAIDDVQDAVAASIVKQYIAFVEQRCMRRPTAATARGPAAGAGTSILVDAEQALLELIREIPVNETTNASQLWPQFVARCPDHVQVLNERWADSKNYSAMSWFAAKLQRIATAGDLLMDAGEWEAPETGWGFPKVRRYRRVSESALQP